MNSESAERIHIAALSLLEDPGIRVEHETIYSLLLRHGGQAGNDAQVVRLPREMVREYVELAPKHFALTNRRGEPTILSAHSNPVYWSCPGMNLWRGGKHRLFGSEDMADMARLMEHLDNVHGRVRHGPGGCLAARTGYRGDEHHRTELQQAHPRPVLLVSRREDDD